MSGKLKIDRVFAEFETNVRDFEKSDDILDILTGLIAELHQNMGAYIGGKFVSVWLGEGERDTGKSENLDLIFVNQDDDFFDIILRQHGALPISGGTLSPAETVTVTHDIVNGYRALVTVDADGYETRYEFDGARYVPVSELAAIPASFGRRKMMR
ncbi:MAG: hypothetical protein ACI9PY_002466 [Ascidiaceihabitans sp.]|jgi:hypothetical protein